MKLPFIVTENMKQCSKCGETKPKSEFGKKKGSKDGLKGQCYACTALERKEYVARNPEKAAEASRKSASKWQKEHRVKSSANKQKYKKDHPDKTRDGYYRRTYGITLADYDQMLVDQGGVCKICGADSPGGRGWRFQVDHCHLTGRVRGLLCYRCNTLLGNAQDSPATLARAIEYLTS